MHAFSPSVTYFSGANWATGHLSIDLLWWGAAKYDGGGEFPPGSISSQIQLARFL